MSKSEAGKGDTRRPRQIPRKEWDRKYDQIDWSDNKHKEKEKDKDD